MSYFFVDTSHDFLIFFYLFSSNNDIQIESNVVYVNIFSLTSRIRSRVSWTSRGKGGGWKSRWNQWWWFVICCRRIMREKGAAAVGRSVSFDKTSYREFWISVWQKKLGLSDCPDTLTCALAYNRTREPFGFIIFSHSSYSLGLFLRLYYIYNIIYMYILAHTRYIHALKHSPNTRSTYVRTCKMIIIFYTIIHYALGDITIILITCIKFNNYSRVDDRWMRWRLYRMRDFHDYHM